MTCRRDSTSPRPVRLRRRVAPVDTHAAVSRWSRVLLGLAATALAACGGSGPTAPSEYPDVAGTYSGPLVHMAGEPGRQQSLDGTMRIIVTQSESRVTVNGSITILGQTAEIPPTRGTINETGEVSFSEDALGGVTNDPDCGESTTALSLVFSDGTATFNQVTQTAECGDSTVSATMTRE